MPQQQLPLEFNKFIAGLNTDASPLTSVPNSSLDEDNFILNIDGSRRRRLGLDYEDSYVKQSTSITANITLATTSYEWKNAGGIPDKILLAVQVGNELKIYNLDAAPYSNALIYTHVFSSAATTQNFSYAVVDGLLAIATGEKTPSILTFTSPSTITLTTTTLYIRDFFGIEDIVAGVDLFDGPNVQVRPTTGHDQHVYNLRNQTFGIPRLVPNASATSDPIGTFFGSSGGQYPSNSDNVNQVLYPDTNATTGNKTVDRFWVDNLRDNPLGTERAPSGYFIIDALARGTSRLARAIANNTAYPTLGTPLTVLPADTTPGGPTVLAQFSGRLFYAGFSGEVTDGDKLSPRMSSYILFSQIVNSVNDIGRCYQVGDPTSKTTPDLVDTDGGYFRLNGAFGIKAMIDVGTSLLVFATNGVWRVYGGNGYSFSATNFVIEKICDYGVNSSDSIVQVDTSVIYWGSDAVYHLHTDQFGSFTADNLSFGHIQTLFNSISQDDRDSATGVYDTYDRKVRWLYYNRVTDNTPTRELVLDITMKAFYTNTIGQLGDGTIPRVIGYIKTPPYTIGSITRETQYITVTGLTTSIKYTFANYKNTSFNDWVAEDGVGVDSPGYLITCYVASSIVGYSFRDDFQRTKSVPYVFVHLNRTENGFIADGDGNLTPKNQSSCLMQARWEWSDSSNSNRWSREVQVYRYKRLYSPVDVDDPFDNGFSTIVTRNRLRGSGKVLSLKFSTEPGMDCHLYGWSLILNDAGTV